MGVDYIISGGQTMNPSTESFVEAIKEVNAENVIISPNNGLLLKKSSFFGRKKEYECRYCGSSWSVQDGADGLIWKKNIN